ncbi:hypothetical protein MKEN_00767200 [Mycena kentingensis (nom. inval.)]|nr:hypothetical protein MKEN_00767200 [Mycena kentingensis (nom. inval.)]
MLPKTKQEIDALAMPPPPVPKGILVPETQALSSTLKNIVVKTGQLYAFYGDTAKLGISHLAPAPPQSLTESLGREVEKYDQLCDAIESKLLRAISVLQRDLARKQRREEEEQAAAAAAAKDDVSMEEAETQPPPPTPDPTQSPTFPSSTAARRGSSAISISSLQRPAAPLKLDLSSSALRMSPEEASLFSQGPTSARPFGPNELPPEIMAVLASADPPVPRVDIDLTNDGPDVPITGIGSTADKPIDLDAMELEMALFGEAEASSAGGEGLFTPVIPDLDVKIKHEEVETDNFLSALSGTGHDDLFGSQSDPGSATLNLEGFSQMSDSGPATGQSYDLEGLDLSFLEDPAQSEAMNFDMEALLGMGGSDGNKMES